MISETSQELLMRIPGAVHDEIIKICVEVERTIESLEGTRFWRPAKAREKAGRLRTSLSSLLSYLASDSIRPDITDALLTFKEKDNELAKFIRVGRVLKK